MTLIWHGDNVMAQTHRKLVQRLDRSAMEWTREAKKRISGVGKSTPGEYPNKRTGNLRKNMNHVVMKKDLIAQVGTNVRYGRFLEEGTKYMEERPWMTLTNNRMRKKIARIMKRPL